MDIQTEVDLKDKNTLAIDSKAEFFAQPATLSELQDVREYAKDHSLALKVLGGGSNVVLADRISGLVLSYGDVSCKVLSENEDTVLLEVGSGYVWHDFIMDSLSRGWFGLENLALIPGTVGAAPVQNIGAYGVEVEEFIESVNGIYLETGELFSFDHEQCRFAYRESCFKQELDGQVLITSVCFRLKKKADVQFSYAPLSAMAEQKGEPDPMTLAQWVVEVRQSKLPDPCVLPNAGSFFKNPVISCEDFDRLQEKYSDIPSYKQAEGIKVPAGWLIDQLGFKGKEFEGGTVAVHKKQALVLVNHGGTAEQVISAAGQIKSAVNERYGISLEQEPRVFR